MNSSKQVMLTKEGFEKLQDKLEHLKTVTRAEVSEKLKIARSFGDLSENSEYDEAKDHQARVESEIAELEQAIKNAVIVEDSNDKSEVAFGCDVSVKSLKDGREFTFSIVGSKEIDPKNNKISSESPVGKALIGRKKGEIVQVKDPAGNVLSEFEVLEIM